MLRSRCWLQMTHFPPPNGFKSALAENGRGTIFAPASARGLTREESGPRGCRVITQGGVRSSVEHAPSAAAAGVGVVGLFPLAQSRIHQRGFGCVRSTRARPSLRPLSIHKPARASLQSAPLSGGLSPLLSCLWCGNESPREVNGDDDDDDDDVCARFVRATEGLGRACPSMRGVAIPTTKS